ncbi:MAG: leukotriene A4 hydrolase C-terminal domain-containing protein, partial [Hymenobacteraceae bacterium]|nr:leukotriene A4 hydrolase C-terminal domain-containing protein [Hymenobacteraceae bacterium]MDX5396568.1 leukotriene A4 hydrolase C-terminal domain-containing protein [Hymenobacteraceae bacterium]MDX5512631.1 leukotriene A4 hydrolase C-terminal domain-containing protein [Hymenobacteraceae bacterium]
TNSGNSEILAAWLLHAIRHDYKAADQALENFLVKVGRRKFLTPLYKALKERPEGLKRALEIYSKARPNYHAVSTNTLDELLNYKQ